MKVVVYFALVASVGFGGVAGGFVFGLTWSGGYPVQYKVCGVADPTWCLPVARFRNHKDCEAYSEFGSLVCAPEGGKKVCRADVSTYARGVCGE